MTNNKRFLFIGIIIFSVYFIKYFFYIKLTKTTNFSPLMELEDAIRHKFRHLHHMYLNRNPLFFMYRNKLLQSYKPSGYVNGSIIWDIVNSWPNKNETYPISFMRKLILLLAIEPITKAQKTLNGTQFKLMLSLANQHKVFFKPKWYTRDYIIEAPINSAKDRHNAEIYSFYLGAVLNFVWTPIVVGHKLNLQLIYKKADTHLKKIMSIKEWKNETRYCLLKNKICGDKKHNIEGAIVYFIPGNISQHTSPWRRTTKKGFKQEWETNMHYCKNLKDKIETTRLLDYIDATIFDFLIQNTDRHTFEISRDLIILIDNGQGFGHPGKDFFDILAPLYQCCMIRKTTWNRLQILSGGVLTDLVDRLTENDVLYPLISKKHRLAIERRLLIVFAVVEYCLDKYGASILKS